MLATLEGYDNLGFGFHKPKFLKKIKKVAKKAVKIAVAPGLTTALSIAKKAGIDPKKIVTAIGKKALSTALDPKFQTALLMSVATGNPSAVMKYASQNLSLPLDTLLKSAKTPEDAVAIKKMKQKYSSYVTAKTTQNVKAAADVNN